MNLTGPQQQQGPALSSWAQRRISLPIATDPSRSFPWAKRMGSGWHGVTVQTVKDNSSKLNLALKSIIGPCWVFRYPD